MASSLNQKGKRLSSGTIEPDGNTASNGGVIQTDSAFTASKLAASASGLTRDLLGIGAVPGDVANALAPSGTARKSQTSSSSGPGASSATWAESSCSSYVGAAPPANSNTTQYRQSFRTETQQGQEPEQEFAKFLESQPVQNFESTPTTTRSYRPSSIGETTAHGQQSTAEPARRARDILIANDVNPNVLTASQFQSFQEQDTSEQQRYIRLYVRSGNATWDPENANGLNTETDYHPQAITEDHSKQPESVLAQRARSLLVINDVNPDLLTTSQFLSFQHEDLSKQKQLIRTYFEDLNSGTGGNGWARQAVNETHASDVRQEQPGASQKQGLHALEPSLHLCNQQGGPDVQQHHGQVNTDQLKAAGLDSPSMRIAVMGRMTSPAQTTSRAQQAIDLLVANGINPEQLTASQFNSFQQQNPNVQQKSVEVYLRNLAQHERSIRQQEELHQQHLPLQEEDGAAVVALLSQPNFLDLIDTSQDDDDDLPPISSLSLTSSQIDTIERLKALLPAPPAYKPSSPMHALNLLPVEALTIPSPWDSRSSDPSYTDFTEHANRRQQWLRDWDGVLRSYADEVWGDLLPLVEEAREEIEEANENDGELRGGGRAIRRLAMVLGHLRDDKNSQHD
ncbi:MAG: hypothetical protein M1839_008031 [Geoglossum umbratile]|nr:MAG: hypothetical protein M1839_008031 [Geoglossum umbratile]